MTASLRELLEDGVAGAPDLVVLRDAGAALTWRELATRAREVASALVRDGVGVQDHVVYVGRNDLRYAELLFGCGLAGAVFTPLNWRLTGTELAAMISDCRARLVLADTAGLAALDGAAHELGATVVALDGTDRAGDAVLAAWRGPDHDPGVPADPAHVAFQLYTSGTTGRPKGAMFANGTNLRVLLDDIAPAWGFVPGDVSLLAMPLFHMGGLAWALAGLARGACGVVVRDFVPEQVLDTMTEQQVTTAFCVPTMLAALCAVPDVARRPLALRQMIYSGSPIGETVLTTALAALRCEFVQIYGLTEATGAFAQLPASEHGPEGARNGAMRSAGFPYPWVEVEVVDPASGTAVARGAVGEIRTRSEQNMLGYWNRPDETAAVLGADGWLRTGDLGRLDDAGRIHLVDRAKDLIITGGENVYPAEVENVLGAHPDLGEAAVIGVPDERWGESVKAVVAARPGAVVDPAEVIAFCRERLARFKCPTSVDVVEHLPRTATGKVVKPALRAPYWRDQDRAIH